MVIRNFLFQKLTQLAKIYDFRALGAGNTDFWTTVKTLYKIHGWLARLLMLSEVIWHFPKIADFRVFWWYFWVSQNRPISRISKVTFYFDSTSKTKNGSTFDEVSIESSVFRAFDRALNEGARYFGSEVIYVLVIWKNNFLVRQISKMSQLAALARRLFKMKSGYAPPPKNSLQK